MENLVDGAIAPEGVKLRGLHDFKSLRTDTYDGVRQAVVDSFPQSYNGYRMEVSDIDYEGPEIATLSEQKKAILQNKYLSRKLRGTVRLVDEKSGNVMDEQRLSLMRVPMITERGSTIHGGNEYFSIMQERLLPGIYTRRQDNGGLETQVNPRPTTGRDMRVGFDPETQQYRMKVQTSDLHLYSLLKDLGHSDDDLRKRWGDELFESNAGKYDARVFEKAFQKLVPPHLRKDKPEYDRDEKAQMIREAFDRVEIHRRVAERNMPGMFTRKVAAIWAAQHLGRVLAEKDMVKVAAELDFLPDVHADTIQEDMAWQLGVDRAEVDYALAGPDMTKTADFEPDLTGDEMKEPYEATYAGVGPRLAGMKGWPEKWYSPEGDQMGWISWYRKFSDGTRTDDDANQIERWKRFKVREGAKFKRNPTARQGFSLRNWAIDPLKLLDKPDERSRMAEVMLDYKQRETEAYLAKKASFSVPELRSIAQFLNREHSAGLDVSQPGPILEEQVMAYLSGEAGMNPGLLQMGVTGAEKAYDDVMDMSKAANEGNPLAQMKLAKKYSDQKQYGAKQAILYGLMKDRPEDFFIDSEDGDIAGITHRPTNFQIHTRKAAIPAEVGAAEPGNLYFHGSPNEDLDGGVLRGGSWVSPDRATAELMGRFHEDTGETWTDEDLTEPHKFGSDPKWKEGREPMGVPIIHQLRLLKAQLDLKDNPHEHTTLVDQPLEKKASAKKVKHTIITGEPTSGKTTAAKKLSEETGKPAIHLDEHEMWKKWGESDTGNLSEEEVNQLRKENNQAMLRAALEAKEPSIIEGVQALHTDPQTLKDHNIKFLDVADEELLRRRQARYKLGGLLTVPQMLHAKDVAGFRKNYGDGVANWRGHEKKASSAVEPIDDYREDMSKEAKAHFGELQEIQDKTIRRWLRNRKAARKATQEPKTEAQAEAGNYPKGKFFMRGMEFTIENRKGSTRKGWKPDGSIAWTSHMFSDYGYVKRTESERDGDHIDVFLGEALESDIVYVVDQLNQKNGKFDEHKCMVGYTSMPEAREAYLECFEKGWKCGKITPITFAQFRDWCFNGDTNKEMAKTRFVIKSAKVEKTIAVDLDGTWAKTVPGPFKQEIIGKPIPEMTTRIRRWLKEGKKVVIFTARAADKRNVPFIENWLDDNDLPQLDITNEKTPNMIRFYDDRAVGVVKNTGDLKAG